MYLAIIGDIIHSKEMNKTKRNEVQNELRETLNEINEQYSYLIASKFLITIGDEFQGLLLTPDKAVKMIDMIQFKMYPVKIRFGIGIGDLDTDIDRNMALGADGPAYHYARKMVDSLKLLQRTKMGGCSNIMIFSGSEEDRNILELINSNLQLATFIELKWTDKQRQLIKIVYIDEKNQMEAAAELEVVQSSVQRRLKTAGYYEFLGSRELIDKTLKEIWRG